MSKTLRQILQFLFLLACIAWAVSSIAKTASPAEHLVGQRLVNNQPLTGNRLPFVAEQTASQLRINQSRTQGRQLASDMSLKGQPVKQLQDIDLTTQTKQARSVDSQHPRSSISKTDLTAEQQKIISDLTNPQFLRELRDKKHGSQASSTKTTERSDTLVRIHNKSEPSRNLPWTADQLLANPTNMNDEYVSLAESQFTGNLYAVFAAKDLGGTDRDVHIAKSLDKGQTWTVNEIPSFNEDEYHPELAIDAAGYIHLTWIRSDGYILRTRSSNPDDTSTWAWVRGLNTGELCATPSIAVSGAGDFAKVFIAAGWSTINTDLYAYEWTLVFMYSSNGGQTITHDYFVPDGYEDYWPDVAMYGGTVHFVNAEVDYYTGETEILIATDVYSGGFADPARLTGWTAANCGFPAVACEGSSVYVVYQLDFSNGITTDGDIIYTYSNDAASSFYGPFELVADEYESVGPAIFTRGGVVGVMWLDAPPNADEYYLAARLAGSAGTSDSFGDVEIITEQPRVEPTYHSCYGVAAGSRIHAAWIDRRDYPTNGHNVYTSRRAVLPDLGSFTPTGWDSSLVAGMTRGDRSSTWLAAGDTSFISFAFINDGLANFTESFRLELQFDGSLLGAWILDGGLEAGTYFPVEDIPVVTTAGIHTLTVSLDTANDVSEADETDNIYSIQLEWVTGDPGLRVNPTRLAKTILPATKRSSVNHLIKNPLVRREYPMQVISTDLATAMDHKSNTDLMRVMIVPALRLDAPAMSTALLGVSKTTRREIIVQAARHQIRTSFDELGDTFQGFEATGLGKNAKPLWLAGSIAMELTSAAIESLAANPTVGFMWLDATKSETFTNSSNSTTTKPDYNSNKDRDIPWHITAIGADQAWSQGHTGTGVLVGHLDTGIAYDHPDFVGQMWDGGVDWPNHGYDAVDDDDNPYDGDSDWFHGTHTSGLIAGSGASGTQTGVAPGATLMALRALPGYMNDMVEAMQFGLDHGVELFSLSGGWGNSSAETRSANRYNAEFLLALDIPWICAAGNGDNVGGHFSIPFDIASPGDCPGPYYAPNGGNTAVITIGAVDNLQAPWNLSSVGPTQWDQENLHGETNFADYPWVPGLMKPDLSAPGVDIVSVSGEGGYVVYSGTSMACPLAAAAACLLKSARPQLTVAQLAEALEITATDITISPATIGRDNYTGAGHLDIPAAFGNLPVAEVTSFFMVNDGVLPLVVDNITWRSRWLSIDTSVAIVVPGDSLAISAIIDPADLAEGNYYDEILFTSNAPGSPHRMPVTLTYGSSVSATPDETPLIQNTSLENRPNPFNPQTIISFEITTRAKTELNIFDIRGRKICQLVNDVLNQGKHEVVWNGENSAGQKMPSGQYFARLQHAGSDVQTRKLLLLK